MGKPVSEIKLNSEILILIISVCLVLLLLLIFIIGFMLVYKKRQARNEQHLKNVKEKYDQEILKTQLEIQEQTLKNISEEIHDNMGQVLSLVVLNLSAVEFNDPATDAARVENSTNLVKRVINDLRNLSKKLDAENMARMGLPAIIQYELELLEKSNGRYRTHFDCSGKEYRLDESRETVAYRVVQESLNNIIKHARATDVKIAIEFTQHSLLICIEDNGQGFDAEQISGDAARPAGAGLKNMRKRIKLIGGEIAIKSIPLNGTQISLTIPVKIS